jgi:hypothetical protein
MGLGSTRRVVPQAVGVYAREGARHTRVEHACVVNLLLCSCQQVNSSAKSMISQAKNSSPRQRQFALSSQPLQCSRL